ncbi:helix-turn-helix domain-containing protein [Flavobacterium sp. PL002]|uniref:helix-turn-helix domain-containing protein n=1 Tax=Flavobacterium sp. PL002 TaxID=1897058 RepID=UPI00178881A4|nr:helix-turn-helix domain-containing protein [Flavobacterium sp. PL002]MBE0393426.1 hypothetical protein [Flavobacterium sp. PL002]
MIIKAILLLILFFCVISFFQLLKSKEAFYTTIKINLALIFIHIFHIFLCEWLIPEQPYLSTAAPYALLYGPIFYYTNSKLQNINFNRYIWFFHLVPFLAFAISYILIFFPDLSSIITINRNLKILNTIIPISFLCYVLASILQKKRVNSPDFLPEVKEFIFTIGMFLVFIAIFSYVAFVHEKQNTNNLYINRLILYSSILAIVIYMYCFLYKINRDRGEITTQSLNSKGVTKPDKYTKVKITEKQLDEYEEKLYFFMSESKIFLDIDLSLGKLSKELKIPKYHLTQLLSLRLGTNFNQFINSYRIKYACNILLKDKDIRLETLIFQSGFNSKSSFNRNFKTITGKTPTEYSFQEIQ